MEIAGLFVYPVKSCAGISVARWQLDDRGLAFDRSFMVVDAATGVFLTQRELPRLALVTPSLVEGGLRLATPTASVTVPTPAAEAERTVRVWEHTGPASDCGDGPADLLTEHLGRTVRLVGLAGAHRRSADPSLAGPGVAVGFSDGFPLLLVGQESLEHLNGRLAHPLPMARFRPNIVVAGAAAFAEDRWRSIRAGRTLIDIVKPCSRCTITTVDPATGRRDGAEPLRTLSTFRRGARGVTFGQNAVHRGPGTLQVGDPVKVVASAP